MDSNLKTGQNKKKQDTLAHSACCAEFLHLFVILLVGWDLMLIAFCPSAASPLHSIKIDCFRRCISKLYQFKFLTEVIEIKLRRICKSYNSGNVRPGTVVDCGCSCSRTWCRIGLVRDSIMHLFLIKVYQLY